MTFDANDVSVRTYSIFFFFRCVILLKVLRELKNHSKIRTPVFQRLDEFCFAQA